MYKLSNFILANLDKEENVVLLNTENNKLIKVLQKDRPAFRNLLLNQEDEYHTDRLYNMGFLKDEDFNVDQYLTENFERITSEKALDLIIMPTEKCNFRCIYCYEYFENGEMSIDYQNSLLQYIEKNIGAHESIHINWFGGEPLIAMDVIENLSHKVMNICKKSKKYFLASMSTNGYLLTIDTFRALMKLNVINYQITLDGPKEVHDKQRIYLGGGGSYDVIMKNLLDIRDNIKSRLIKVNIRVNIANNITQEQLNEYYAYLKSEFGHDRRFAIRFFKVWDGTLSSEENVTENEYYDLLAKAENLSTETIKEISTKKLTCYAAKKSSIVIGSNGDLYKCTVHFDDPINKIGNIQDSIIDREKYNFWTLLTDEKKKDCLNCPLIPYCFGTKCPYTRPNIRSCKILCDYILNLIKACSDNVEVYEI